MALPEEHLTDDLLKQLLASESPEAYLDTGETIDRELPDYLRALLTDRCMNRSQLSSVSGVTTSYVYQIFDGSRTPGRNTAIRLAFGLQCSVVETQRLLRLAGVSELWPKRRRDAIILWCETEPSIDMIKLIARELDVPVTELLDMPEEYCQSCGMMFTAPGQHGHEADGTETADYCRWCYDGGAYTYETNMDEMIEDCAPRMGEAMGWSVDEAASLLGAILPTLDRWRKG